MTDTKELGKRLSKSAALAEAQAEGETPEPAAKPSDAPETPETLTPEPPENEPEAKPTATPSPEQQQKAFDRAVTAFHAKLCALFEVAELQPAESPGVVGFVLPGFLEKKPHDDFTRCTVCNGYGQVLTGSLKVPDNERPCPDPRCKGRGYWERAHAPAPTAATILPLPTAQTNGAEEWGEAPAWMGDPRLSTPPA